MVYLLLLQCRPHDSPKQGSWSVVTLKRYFMPHLAQAPLERGVKLSLCKGPQEHKAAYSIPNISRFQEYKPLPMILALPMTTVDPILTQW